MPKKRKFRSAYSMDSCCRKNNMTNMQKIYPTGQLVRVQDKDMRKWTPAIVRQARAEPRSYIIETPTGQVLHRNCRHHKEDVSNSNKTLVSLHNTSTHHTEPPSAIIPNTHPAEKPNIHRYLHAI